MVVATESTLKILCDDSDNALLSSANYTALIAAEPTLYRCAALCCRSIAAQFAEKVNVAAGSVKTELGNKFDHYMDLAKTYDNRAKGGGVGNFASPELTGISIAANKVLEEDTDRVPKTFKVGIQDNKYIDPVTQESS